MCICLSQMSNNKRGLLMPPLIAVKKQSAKCNPVIYTRDECY